MSSLKKRMAPRTREAAPVKETFQTPEESTGAAKKTSINMRPELHKRARIAAAAEGIKLWQLIDAAVEKYLSEKGQ